MCDLRCEPHQNSNYIQCDEEEFGLSKVHKNVKATQFSLSLSLSASVGDGKLV